MAKDIRPTSPSPFTAALAGFRRWTKTTERKLAGDPGADVEEIRALLDLMRDYLEIERPAELGQGDLEELLLRIYPRKITVLDRADTEDTIPAVRDFLAYLAGSGQLPEGTARTLERELDRIAPRFTDAVMDPSNWGMARSFVQEMAAAGVDINDQVAVDRWIAALNAHTGPAGAVLDPEDDEDIDFKEAFGLPDRLPPMRLPSEAELAGMARGTAMIGRLRALAAWLGPARAVTENAELAGGDAAEAAAALGIGVPPATDEHAPTGVTELPAVGRMRDLSRLDDLWRLGLDTGFIELDDDETHAVPGEVSKAWPDSDDDYVLDGWNTLFALVLGALDVAASRDPRRSRELDFFGQGAALAVLLFLARGNGVPVAEASEMVRSAAVDELSPDRAAKAWPSWVRAHGDPAKMVLDQLAALGAVRVAGSDDGDVARLTPLGLAAIRQQFVGSGVEIPLLPPADQMAAADLIAMADGADEEEFQAETAAWLSSRTPESAASELLSVAADSDPASRILAVAVATELGAAAEPAWRDALGQVELRGYARAVLATLASGDPAVVPPGFELADDELAWMLTDSLVVDGWDDVDGDAEYEPADLAERLRDAIPAGRELAAFEMMARVPHPDAVSVLTTIGRYHPDKRIAKIARKSAYKAASRHAARQ
jgi:hypothetical protein